MKHSTMKAWQQYEAGKEYNRRIGLYETVRKNERFYRGDQWYGSNADLPHPVFNMTRRITDYLVAAVAPDHLSITYTDDRLPFLDNAEQREAVTRGLQLLGKNADYRWKRDGMKALSYKALLDAAITGDSVLYCWWDAKKKNGQLFGGDLHTDLVENTALFVSDVNRPDIQSQEYLILAGRAGVEQLKDEAREAGVCESDVAKIIPDVEEENSADLLSIEQAGSPKATYLLTFFRENGEVVFEKSTKSCLIKRVHTGLKLYPVVLFNWHAQKHCFHGSAPVSDIIANQKYVNTAYAMAMKHMSDTAFSKVVYDKSRIPEWNNEVGQAIAAVGGGSISDAVSVLGVGSMQEGYLELITNVIETTKGMMGATDSALGDEQANNTSAILALQKASRISLMQVRTNFCKCIGELAAIWADMLCAYSVEDRLLPVENAEGVSAERMSYRLFKGELLSAAAEVEDGDSYTPSATVTLLDKLLEGGHINAEQYLDLLPSGTVMNRKRILQEIQSKGEVTHG